MSPTTEGTPDVPYHQSLPADRSARLRPPARRNGGRLRFRRLRLRCGRVRGLGRVRRGRRLPGDPRAQVRQYDDQVRAEADRDGRPHRPGRGPRARQGAGRDDRVAGRLQGRDRPVGQGRARLRRRAHRAEGHRHRTPGGADRRAEAGPDPRRLLGAHQVPVREPVEVRPGRRPAEGVQRLRRAVAGADRGDRQGARPGRQGEEAGGGRRGEVRRGQEGQPVLRRGLGGHGDAVRRHVRLRQRGPALPAPVRPRLLAAGESRQGDRGQVRRQHQQGALRPGRPGRRRVDRAGHHLGRHQAAQGQGVRGPEGGEGGPRGLRRGGR